MDRIKNLWKRLDVFSISSYSMSLIKKSGVGYHGLFRFQISMEFLASTKIGILAIDRVLTDEKTGKTYTEMPRSLAD